MLLSNKKKWHKYTNVQNVMGKFHTTEHKKMIVSV